jgi:hypothetical chaperone protein
VDLSSHSGATFSFPDVGITRHVSRSEFETWISQRLTAIEACVECLLGATGTAPSDIDRVFLTGGSSFVPSVRQIFFRLFGSDKVVTGDEFTSVAKGLVLLAAEA